MPVKLLISDIDQGHGDTCLAKAELECPSLEGEVRIETLAASIVYALANEFHIISRSTTGLNDARNENEGDTAYEGEELTGDHNFDFSNDFSRGGTFRVGIVHAHGSNSHILLTDPSRLDIIMAIGAGDGAGNNNASYGDGLEIFNDDETTESYATARIAGIIAQLMTDHPTWTFHDARMTIRQTASLYGTGWIADGGFGASDKVAANLVETIAMFSPYRVEITHDAVSKTITFNWKNSPQTDGFATIIAKYGGAEPERTNIPTQSNARIIYNGSLETFLYDYSTAFKNIFWFVVHTEGSYSLIESFDKEEISLGREAKLIEVETRRSPLIEAETDGFLEEY